MEDLLEQVTDYLNNKGLYNDFKDFIEKKGYSMEELGFPDEED